MITMNKTGEIRTACPSLGTIKNRGYYSKEMHSAAYAQQNSSQDRIEISAQGAYQAKLESIRQSGAEKTTASISAQRMEQLKAAYAGNQCPVSGEQIAGAMLNGIFGKGAV